MAQTDKHTDRQTSGHGNSMTDSAQRAESVKIHLGNIVLPSQSFGRHWISYRNPDVASPFTRVQKSVVK